MSTLTISLPESVRSRFESLAQEDGVPVEDFVSSVLSQRVEVAEADSYVRRRALRGSAAQMKEILEAAPKVDPDVGDQLPTIP